jgi:hypothetical protein
MFRSRYAFSAVIVVCATALTARAQLPATTLTAYGPPGGKIGSTFDITLNSASDAEACDRLLFSHPGITGAPKTEPSVLFAGKKDVVPNKFTVTIGNDVPPGVYDMRLAGPLGISNPRGFAVDQWNEVLKEAGNRTLEKAQVIPFGSTVSGAFEANGEDHYKFTAKKGTRVLIDVLAQRIDSKADATLVVFDAAGKELARNRDLNRRDPLVDLVIPADGDYIVKVYDFTFNGGVDYFYRLAVHAGPYVDFVFPPSVRAGEKNKLTVYGRNLPGGSPSDVVVAGRKLDKLDVVLDVPKNEPTDVRAAPTLVRASEAFVDAREYRLKTSGGKSNAVLLGYAQAPIVIEQEPNDAPEKAQKVTIPCEVVGQFNPRGDLDAVQFDAKKGDVVIIDVVSQRLGFTADPWLLVQRYAKDKDGNTELKDVKEVDEDRPAGVFTLYNNGTNDPYFRFTAAEDGTYRVVLRDLYGDARGEARLIYRLILRKPEPDFRLLALPLAMSVNKGGGGTTYKPTGTLVRSGEAGAVTVVAARQDGYEGPIKLRLEGLPKGYTVPETILGAKQDSVSMTFKVPEKSESWRGTVRVVGTAKIDDKDVSHEARGAAILLEPGQNNRPAESRMTRDLALAAGGPETAPCLIELGDGKPVASDRGTKVTIPVKVTRRNDFKEALQLNPIGLPAYAKMQPLTLNAADKDGKVTIELDNGAPVGELSFALSAVVAKVQYARNKSDVDAAEQLKKDAAKAAAAMTEAAAEAKKKAAAAPKEKKAEADKAAADAAEAAKKADAAKKALDARADAVVKAGQMKTIQNVPIASTHVTLKITEPPPKTSAKK